MIFDEKEYLNTLDKNVKINVVEVFPSSIDGVRYLVPSSIYNNSFPLKCICMFYRSDEYKVILTRETNKFPKRLVESTEKVFDDDHDPLLIAMKFQDYNYEHLPMGKKFPISGERYVRISLYKVGVPEPLEIIKFQPSNPVHPWITLGYDFSMKSGAYFLLFDNVLVDLEEFNTFESFAGKYKFKWWGSKSFGKTFYLDNNMLVLPFQIYPRN